MFRAVFVVALSIWGLDRMISVCLFNFAAAMAPEKSKRKHIATALPGERRKQKNNRMTLVCCLSCSTLMGLPTRMKDIK